MYKIKNIKNLRNNMLILNYKISSKGTIIISEISKKQNKIINFLLELLSSIIELVLDSVFDF